MKYKKIVIAGGTGFIGQAMARYFGKDNHIVILGRQSTHGHNNNYNNKLVSAADGYNITYWRWNPKQVEKHWARELEAADIVINLAGQSVNCRYTEKNKQAIINSRTASTETIGKAISQTTVPPKLWINATSATIYHNETNAPQDEETGIINIARNDNMPYSCLDRLRQTKNKFIAQLRYGKASQQYQQLNDDFSVAVCRQWEQSFFEQRTPFTRKIALRMAIALGSGGVMEPYYNLVKYGLGGHQGKGDQMYSWIHMEDLCRIVTWCYEHTDMEGVYNCAAPNAVSNNSFMQTLRNITGHKIGLPAFNWMVEIGAALLGTESELMLKSRWVYPRLLLQSGFQFRYNQLEQALTTIINNTPRKKYHLF